MCTDCSFPRAVRRRVQASPFSTPVEVAPGLEVYPRSAWASTTRPPKGDMPSESVLYFVVHHSAGPQILTSSDAIVEIQEIYDYQTGPRKNWPDVGYNFFVDRFGRVFEGRAGSLGGPVAVDVTGGNSGFAQSICVLGDFTEEVPTDAAQESLIKVLAWLADGHQLDTGPEAKATFTSKGSDKWPAGDEVTVNTISPHQAVSETTCPGTAFAPMVSDQLPARVAAYRTGQPADTAAASVSTAAERSAPSSTDSVPQISGPTTSTTSTTTSSTSTTAPTTTSTTTTTAPATTESAATSTSVAGPEDGDTNPLRVFAMGAIGGTASVAAVVGLAWVINRRQENARRHGRQ